MTIRDELLKVGYESRGIVNCPKCSQPVELFNMTAEHRSSGVSNKYLNPPDHEDRPSGLHSLICGRNLQQDFEQGAARENV